MKEIEENCTQCEFWIGYCHEYRWDFPEYVAKRTKCHDWVKRSENND